MSTEPKQQQIPAKVRHGSSANSMSLQFTSELGVLSTPNGWNGDSIDVIIPTSCFTRNMYANDSKCVQGLRCIPRLRRAIERLFPSK